MLRTGLHRSEYCCGIKRTYLTIDESYIVEARGEDISTIKLAFELGEAVIEEKEHFAVLTIEFGN